MKKTLTAVLSALAMTFLATAQTKVNVTVDTDPQENKIIPKEIYGHFAEHLGACIYGGLWVGPESEIPNVDGYRTDVLEALKTLKVPVMRWPGGCFADEYHWRDGIGPRENRPRMVNSNWGGTVEDNSFGTHEFLNLCEMIGCEPYISGNVGSGTVEELAKWVEYMTAADGPMARLRAENGRTEPWKVKYLGVGNESWGCGGNMVPEYYSHLYNRYQTYCRDYSGNRLYKVASGASDYDYNWTEVLMKNIGGRMHGISLHYYTVKGWDGSKGSATDFTAEEYYNTLGKAVEVESVIQKHIAIMDRLDPEKKVDLLLDEWGTWFDVEPGTNPGHLYQQNSMRDAMVAALSFNIFHKYTERLKMANIAQIANVLQSMVLTRGDQMVLTPTYHVFRMYNVHQDATYLPLTCDSKSFTDGNGRECPIVDATASRDADGKVHVTITNTDLAEGAEVTVDLGKDVEGNICAEVLTSINIQDHNDFGNGSLVAPVQFTDYKVKSGRLVVNMPAKSIVSLTIL
ncbi:MAG: alpha-N-arabinofuranosidase [Bacteroidales bacterium]|nr:alpha-N-arabinofuranosidase [Bacteroidales bacterium]